MDHRSIVDQALARAQERLNSGASTKTASAPSYRGADGVKKEASELASALEYLALKVADDGSASGAISAEMARDFFKKANEPKTPESGPTMASGEQKVAPNHGRTSLNTSSSATHQTPATSASRDGKMDRSVMEQPAPAVRSAPEVKKANLSLYDILQAAQEGKTAGVGPAEMTADQPAPGIPTANENANRHSLLDSAEGIRNATKREAKAPTRARLAELFASASDTTGRAGADAAFPGAAAKGGLKVASIARAYAESRKQGSAINLSALKGEPAEKKGSVGEYSQLWDLALTGELGDEAKAYALQIVEQVSQ